MKTMLIYLSFLFLSFSFFSCKKKNFKEAVLNTTQMEHNTLSYPYFSKNLENKLVRIETMEDLDSLKPVANGYLNNVNLETDVIYIFSAGFRGENGKGLELMASKTKILEQDKQIDFCVKVKGYDGKSSSLEWLIGVLVFPKTYEDFEVGGTALMSNQKLFNSTGSGKNQTQEF